MEKTPIKVPASGSKTARYVIVGEAPGADEEARGIPFIGSSGQELFRMLHEVGFIRQEFFITNVCKYRPPGNDITAWIDKKPKPDFVPVYDRYCHPLVADGVKELWAEIEDVKPELILAFGNTALWALTEGRCDGIIRWRGSQLTVKGIKMVPTIHPAAILRQWEMRSWAVQDIRRAKDWLAGRREPRSYNFVLRPTFRDVMAVLDAIPPGQPLAVDLETRAGHIACCGIAWSPEDAICIPFMCVENPQGYFSPEEELAIILRLKALLTQHPVIGQNFNYDAQYIFRYWRFLPTLTDDTMIAQGVCFPGLPKSLHFIASLYNRHYIYWKDDGKEWNPKLPEERLWAYNCEDACRTFEAMTELNATIDKLNVRPQYSELILRWWAVLEMEIRGVRVNTQLRDKLIAELKQSIAQHEAWFETVCGHPLNVGSSKQMQDFFYHDLGVKPVTNRSSGRPTLDDKALDIISVREPLLTPLIQKVRDLRSARVFLNTFALAPLDQDKRIRSEFNVVGTETFRFSSSTNPFGSGMNLQNIPKGDSKLPNIRRMFTPDDGYIIIDADLDRADLQVVVWEANDAELKQMLREGVDIHAENAKLLGISRQLAKTWVHGTNYNGSPRTMAANCGITVHLAETLRKKWFAAHPGIKEWHNRVQMLLMTQRKITNRFGFHRIYFGRAESLLSEALAWIPQSTVAQVINRGLLNLALNVPECQLLIQVHDSLVFQIPADRTDLIPIIEQNLRVQIPYDDPLIIPVGIKQSEVSWGDVSS